jgi:hypothetical protein
MAVFFGCARRLRQGYVAMRVVAGWYWFTKRRRSVEVP